MANKNVAVLDFGSSKITLIVGHKGVNNSFKIVASSEGDYAGFMAGDFIEPNLLCESVKQTLNNLYEHYPKRITKLYIGVPAEFCYNLEKDLLLNLNGRKRINDKHLLKLFCSSADNVISSSHTVINKSPMYYTIDGTKVSNPINCYASELTARTSFVLVKNQFVYLMNSVMQEVGIADFELLSSILTQGVFLLPQAERDNGTLLVDCGYITTSVAYFIGDGIADLKSFSMGGGFITSDISEVMGLPFGLAEQVKRKLILTLKPTGLDYYEVYDDNEAKKVLAKDANNVALARLDEIADNIQKCLDSFANTPAEHLPIYLTGGGLSYLKGIKYYLGKELGRNIIIVKPSLQYSAPDLSSVISLLNAGITIKN